MKYTIFDENFLSRLCGGEQAVNDAQAAAVFLSRLCGGERRGDRNVGKA